MTRIQLKYRRSTLIILLLTYYYNSVIVIFIRGGDMDSVRARVVIDGALTCSAYRGQSSKQAYL